MVVFGIELWWFLMHMLLCFPQFGVIWLLWQFSANPVDWYLVFWAFPFTSLLRFTFDNLDSVVRTHCWAWKVLFMRFGFLVSRTVRNLLPSAKGHLVLRHFFLRLLSNYAATLKNCCFYIPKTLNFVSYIFLFVSNILPRIHPGRYCGHRCQNIEQEFRLMEKVRHCHLDNHGDQEGLKSWHATFRHRRFGAKYGF